MNKYVLSALVIFTFMVGYYLVSFATAGGHLGNVPVTPDDGVPVQMHDSVPHHQAPSHVAPHGDHTGVPFEGNSNCAPSDAHRTDVPLDVPADAPQAERDKMTNYLNHLLPKDDKPADELWVPLPPRTPMTGTFPCDVPAAS